MCAEPTGCAVSMYSATTAFKMAALRWSSPVSPSTWNRSVSELPERETSLGDRGTSLSARPAPWRRFGGGLDAPVVSWLRSTRLVLLAFMVLAVESTECQVRPTGWARGRFPTPAPADQLCWLPATAHPTLVPRL